MGKDTFNRQLNASGQPDRQFSRWQKYRESLTGFILANMGDIKSMLIIGAGNCNDVDLLRLKADEREVILTDIDLSAMELGCQRQGVEVECISIDYLGLETSSILETVKQQMLMFNTEAFKKVLDKIVQSTEEHHWQWEPVCKRLVVVLPIYTQLLYRQLESILNDACVTDFITEEEFAKAMREVLDRMPRVINAFNQQLITISHKDAGMVIFSDYIEDKTDGDYSRNFGPESFEDTYGNYYNQYGMGLGHYGVFALSQNMKVMKEQWYLWPFDENRHMFVKGIKVMYD